MPRDVVIITPEQVELRYTLAGIGARFYAILIDLLWQIPVYALIIIAAVALEESALGSANRVIRNTLLVLLLFAFFAVTYGYFLLFEALRNGQTPGKRAAGIRVISDSGAPVTFRQVLLRNVMRIVDSLPSLYALGIISVWFSNQGRRLGDYVAGTLVVYTGRTEAAPPPMPDEVADETAAPVVTGVPLGKLTRDQYRILRHYLDRRREMEPELARQMAATLIPPLVEALEVDPDSVGEPEPFIESVVYAWERATVG